MNLFLRILAVFVYSISSTTVVQADEINQAMSLIEQVCGKGANKGERLEVQVTGSGSAKTMKLISVRNYSPPSAVGRPDIAI